jgi:hypothetical protein
MWDNKDNNCVKCAKVSKGLFAHDKFITFETASGSIDGEYVAEDDLIHVGDDTFCPLVLFGRPDPEDRDLLYVGIQPYQLPSEPKQRDHYAFNLRNEQIVVMSDQEDED